MWLQRLSKLLQLLLWLPPLCLQLLRLLLPLLLLQRLLLLEVGWPVKSHLSKWQPNRFTGRGPRQRPQRHEPQYDPPIAQRSGCCNALSCCQPLCYPQLSLSAGGRLLGSARLGLWLGSARPVRPLLQLCCSLSFCTAEKRSAFG